MIEEKDNLQLFQQIKLNEFRLCFALYLTNAINRDGPIAFEVSDPIRLGII